MSNDAARYLTVRLEHATVRRGARAVLHDVSWTVRPGERWLLAGANGAGKTQLLKVLAGIVWPAPAPKPVLRYRLGRREAVTPYGIKDEIAYLGAERQDKYERYGWDVCAARIVGTGVYRTDVPLDVLSAADARRVRSALRALGILHLAQRPFLSLSYGERRVVLLARALASRPRLLLLDEVLNGLDAANRQRILAWLASRRRRLPWVFATHDAADVPALTTHALLLRHGRVAYSGTLRRAPLARWLGQRRAHPAPAGRGAPARGRQLVRLANARVYLDERRVLNGLSLSVHAGEWWLVHGHNGSGKTTLLRTLYGDHGVAAGGAIERAALSPGMPLEDFKKRVGLVAPHLHSDQPRQLTVAAVVQSGRHASIGLNAAPSAADRAAARRVLARLGLSRLASRQLAQLSYGQSRRVLFARALVRDPQLLLLDEPFAGLDVPTRRALTRRLCALAAGPIAVVVTAHRPEEWRGCATHELELADGQARYCGPLRRRSEPRR